MKVLYIQCALALAAIAVGGFIFFRPKKSIELQIAFYRLINWIIEPVSMEKEIRNTRLMGGLVLVCGVLFCLYMVISYSG